MIRSTVWTKSNTIEHRLDWVVSKEDIKDLIKKQVERTYGEGSVKNIKINSVSIEG